MVFHLTAHNRNNFHPLSLLLCVFLRPIVAIHLKSCMVLLHVHTHHMSYTPCHMTITPMSHDSHVTDNLLEEDLGTLEDVLQLNQVQQIPLQSLFVGVNLLHLSLQNFKL